jgi:hypothetical protein
MNKQSNSYIILGLIAIAVIVINIIILFTEVMK